MIENFINENKENIIESLKKLIQIPSVYSKSDNPK